MIFPVLNVSQAPVMPPFVGLIRREDYIHCAGRKFSSCLLCQCNMHESMRLPSGRSFQTEFCDCKGGLFVSGELIKYLSSVSFSVAYSLRPFPLPRSVYHIIIHFPNLTIICVSYTTQTVPYRVISCILKRKNEIVQVPRYKVQEALSLKYLFNCVLYSLSNKCILKQVNKICQNTN